MGWRARLAALLVLLAPLSAAGAGLAGQLLVATPELDDPNFENTVVLIVSHDKNGALGLVVNDMVMERPFASLMADLGLDPEGATGDVRVFAGGPVQRDKGFVLHSTEYARPETLVIDGRFSLTTSAGIFRDMAVGKGPKKALVVFGYAGWGPGQLEREIAQHGWFTEPADPAFVFDEPPQRMWQDAIERRPRDL